VRSRDDFDGEAAFIAGVGEEDAGKGTTAEEAVGEAVAGDLLDVFLLHHLN
jgi:hypothetical protein